MKKNDTHVVLETVNLSQHTRSKAGVIALTVRCKRVAAPAFERSWAVGGKLVEH
jgi:hypothetical protein